MPPRDRDKHRPSAAVDLGDSDIGRADFEGNHFEGFDRAINADHARIGSFRFVRNKLVAPIRRRSRTELVLAVVGIALTIAFGVLALLHI